MKIKTSLFAGLIAFCALCVLPVHADHHGKKKSAEEVMEELDTDKSGTLSETEASKHKKLKKGFKKADVNEDGELDLTELKSALEKKKKKKKDAE